MKVLRIYLLCVVTLMAAIAARADVVPQTTDDTNPETYQGWVDNTDGHITSITHSTWKAGAVPKERFIYINSVNFPDADFRRYFSGTLYSENADAINAALAAGTYNKRGKTALQNVFWISDNYATQTGYFTEQELGLITKMTKLRKEAVSLEGIKYFTCLQELKLESDGSVKSLDVSGMTGLQTLCVRSCNSLESLDISGTRLRHLDTHRCNNLKSINFSDTQAATSSLLTYSYSDNVDGTGYIVPYNSLEQIDLSRNKLPAEIVASFLKLNVVKTGGVLYAYDNSQGDEGNDQVTTALVAAAKAKNWTVKVKQGGQWVDYTQAPIAIDATNFPDAAFRDYIHNHLYSDNQAAIDNAISSGTISGTPGVNPFASATELTFDQLMCITNIDFQAHSITNVADLTGIKHFGAIKTLNCCDNQLTQLDVSKLLVLENLKANHNRLTRFDITGCVALTAMELMQNQISNANMNALYKQVAFINPTTTIYTSNFHVLSNGVKFHVFDDTDPSITDDNQMSEALATFLQGEKIIYGNNSYYSGGINWRVYQYYNVPFDGNFDDWVYINETNFPDKFFRKYICEQAYEDNQQFIAEEVASGRFTPRKEGANPFYYYSDDNYIFKLSHAEVALIRELNINKWRAENRLEYSQAYYVTNLTGVQLLDSLEHLYVQGHGLTSLDVSNMKKLRILRCHDQKTVTTTVEEDQWGKKYIFDLGDGGLQTLNVQGCDSLFQIYCDHNLLTELDVRTCGNMKELRCNNNPLGDNGLDVTLNPHMIWLDCYNCNLAELNVTENTVLERLYCYETRDGEASGTPRRGRITGLDLSKNPKLWELRISNLPLADLDLSKNTDLKILYANNMDLSGGKLNGNLPRLTALQELSCFGDTLDALDVSRNTALRKLYCYNNQIPTLDLSQNTALQVLVCGDNQTGVDERDVPLPNGGNRLTTLDLSKNTALTTLRCAKNNLVELDLSEQPLLAELNYEEQTRDIKALFTRTREDKTLYYLRMDKDTNDEGGPLLNEMARTDHAGTSLFDINRVDMTSWTHNCELYHGTFVPEEDSGSGAPRRVAPTTATADDLIQKYVIGDILILTPDDVTGNDTDGYTATGYAEYKYDTRLHPDATVTDPVSNFHLNWSTQPNGPITGVDEVTPAADVVSVTYHNLAGMTSDRPFEGVNIVTTRHRDGRITTSKVVVR